MLLKDKTILITGSTRGIGKDIAIKCAQEGANLIISGTKQETVDNCVSELKASYTSTIVGIACNVSDYQSCQAFVKEALEKCPKIDVLINNAGITKDNLVLRLSDQDFDDVIKTNLNSACYLTKLLSKHMLRNKSGNIINMSSVVGVMGNAGQANYAASKAGLIGLSKSIAKEFGAKGIRCNAIAPGFIETDMINTLPEEYVNNIIQSVPIKRLGKTEDVSNLVVFLASDKSSYITGQVISVDGGMAM